MNKCLFLTANRISEKMYWEYLVILNLLLKCLHHDE